MSFSGKCFICRRTKDLPFVRDDAFICSECNNMRKEKINFVKLDEPNFEKIFEVSAEDSMISKVSAFEPEYRGGEIVLPMEFTKTDGEKVTLGFTLDREHLRDLFEAGEFPETIG